MPENGVSQAENEVRQTKMDCVGLTVGASSTSWSFAGQRVPTTNPNFTETDVL